MEEKRENIRVFFGEQKWKASILVPREALEASSPSFMTPWDLSVSGFSFLTDVSFKLDASLDILLVHPQLESAIAVAGKVIRVDQIRELDNPVISYKIALRFDDIEPKSYESIRGLTE